MTLALLCICALFCLGPAGAALSRARFGGSVIYGGSLGICAVLVVVGLLALPAAPTSMVLPLGLPWTGAHFRLDALAAFFLVTVNVGGVGASLFALGHEKDESEPQRVLPFFPVFLGALNLVVAADDAFTFLFGWELMSLASWALVVAHHRDPENVRAGFVYLLMATISGLTLLLAFGLLAGPSGHFAFADMRAGSLTSATSALVFSLVLFGAGSKAGLAPFHAWLPLAHPAAPTPVSALMSGVMTKVAIYAFIRIALDLAGGPGWQGAAIVLAFGGASAALGVLYAVNQTDVKRLLAYSTVENVGIVFIGLGLAMAFRSAGLAAAAALALSAALLHVFNHAIFKSLLFYGAGAILKATGLRDLENMGGLIHRMPKSSLAILIGCAAISSLPPLNGFASEWLTLQAILLRPDLPQWGLKVIIPTDGALLALSTALAAACFVRFYGIAFLGRPRSASAEAAKETDAFTLAALFGAAGLCALAGLLPGPALDALAPVSQLLLHARLPPQGAIPWLAIEPIGAKHGAYSGLLIFLFVATCAGAAALLVRRFASRALRRAPIWDCGYPDLRPATQYSASSFAQPLRRVFGSILFRAHETVTMPPPGSVAPATIRKFIADPIWDALYASTAAGVNRAADLLNRIQFFTIRRYLSFVFVLLVALLLALATLR